MGKWIELTSNERSVRMLINVERVDCLVEGERGSFVNFGPDDAYVIAKETYDEIKALIYGDD